MGLSIGPKIGVEGASEFRAEFKEMIAVSGMLQSQMDALTASFSKYDSSLKNNERLTAQLNNQITNQKAVVASATEGYEMAQRALKENQEHLESTRKTLELVRPSIDGMTQKVNEAKAAFEAQNVVYQEAAQRAAEAKTAVTDMKSAFMEQKAALDQAKDAQKAATDEQLKSTTEALKAYQDAEKQYTKNAEAQVRVQQTIAQTTPLIEQQREKVNALQAEFDRLNGRQELYKAGADAAKERVRQLTAEYGKMATSTKEAREMGRQYTAQIQAHKDEVKAAKDELDGERKALEKLEKTQAKAQSTLADLQSKEEALTDAVMRAGDAFEEESQKLGVEQKALEDINVALEENKRLYGEQGEERQALRAEREAAIAESDKEKEKLNALGKEQEKQIQLLKETKREVSDLEDEVTSTEKKIDVARETIAKWGDVMYTAKAKLEELLKKLRETPQAFETMLESAKNIGDGMVDFGKTLTKYVTVPLTTLGTFGVKKASDFTDALAKISTIADTTKVPLETFRTEIQRISDATGRSVDDVSAATYQALSAAVDTEEAIEFVEGAANLARAGFLDLYGSVDVLTTILNSYKKNVDEVEHISDVLVKTQDMGKLYLFVFNAKNRYMPFALATA